MDGWTIRWLDDWIALLVVARQKIYVYELLINKYTSIREEQKFADNLQILDLFCKNFYDSVIIGRIHVENQILNFNQTNAK